MTDLILLAAFVVIPITGADLLLRVLARKKPHWLYTTPPETEHNMTLAEQIGKEHWKHVITEECACLGYKGYAQHQDFEKHLIEVTEHVVRAQIAGDIADYTDATLGLIDSQNGARLAFDKITAIVKGQA